MECDHDLIVIVPDGAILSVVYALLARRRSSLRIRTLSFDVIKDPLHDASPKDKAVHLLRGYLRSHYRAMVIRDLEGSGWEKLGAEALREAISKALIHNGWEPERITVIIIEPELEVWLRLGSVHMQKLVRERARQNAHLIGQFTAHVRMAIDRSGGERCNKPARPKEAFAALLEQYWIPPSNALFTELAQRESIEGCSVPSFCDFVGTLRKWFPVGNNDSLTNPSGGTNE